ncbi:uncharacterized protein LOC106754661 [Vigna radiata var. radiata]|uniref:Uncharacterized protein LOC106754661 n=1 Tax=Vigna radiata var. radiata TaxID=3916 RepID=A0A1S3TEK0_VIGRR|nr:uncharacterized protein LOC106754661 [Vigna radiata var. radiata]
MAAMRAERGNGAGVRSAQSVNVETVHSVNGEESNPATQEDGTREATNASRLNGRGGRGNGQGERGDRRGRGGNGRGRGGNGRGRGRNGRNGGGSGRDEEGNLYDQSAQDEEHREASEAQTNNSIRMKDSTLLLPML